jgi:hypothetical protein
MSPSSSGSSLALLAICFTLVPCLDYYSNLKMEATYSSETSVDFQRIIWRYFQEDRTLHMIGYFANNLLSRMKNEAPWTLSRCNTRQFTGRHRKKITNSSQDSRSQNRYLKPGPPEWGAEVTRTWPRRSRNAEPHFISQFEMVTSNL